MDVYGRVTEHLDVFESDMPRQIDVNPPKDLSRAEAAKLRV
jgi:hypothetical protein